MGTIPAVPTVDPTADSITLEQTLKILEGPFSAFATAITHDQYALWIGSGISRDRVPPLREVVLRVIAYLQSRIAPPDPNCRFRAVLQEILALIGFSDQDGLRNTSLNRSRLGRIERASGTAWFCSTPGSWTSPCPARSLISVMGGAWRRSDLC